MKKYSIKTLAVCLLASNLALGSLSAQTAQRPMLLHYDRPGITWMTQGLPIGNGELGAMFMGGYRHERIQFNEKTLWTGSPQIRGAYQNFGDLYLDLEHHPDYNGYKRSLSLDDAIGRVVYTSSGTQYEREYLASHPDGIIAVRLTTPNQKGKLSLEINLRNARSASDKIKATTSQLQAQGATSIFEGELDLVSYVAGLQAINDGGSIELTKEQNGIKIKDANAVTLYLALKTNYDIHSPSYISGSLDDVRKHVKQTLARATAKGYERIKADHIADYQKLYNRVKINLEPEAKGIVPTLPTDEIVRRQRSLTYLDELYFQYGRYLMIASSRGMDLPNNLQGLWNDSNTPPWESDIHTNINIQMNYWPAETTNLSECHKPFLHYIAVEAAKENGGMRQTAKNEGLRGWSLHTQSNIFSHTDWNINRPTNAWYAMHLWQHYLFTQDKHYLEQTALPAMRSACEYWFDRLKKDEHGRWIAPAEWSPEHGPWEDGIAYAQQLIWELFDATLQASERVKLPKPFVAELKDKLKHLDRGMVIGSWGQIREWKIKEDIKGDEHRHLSHLIALYPGKQISWHTTPNLAKAAKISLESRGDDGTGWSRAWKIALWARLGDGDHARHLLKQALNYTSMTGNSMDVRHGGVYENLLDAHPPFQIDGNFGATAGIAEMLLQSHLGFIELLPALPKAWSSGAISGLRAAGDFTLGFKWNNGRITQATIHSGSGLPLQIMGKALGHYNLVDHSGKVIRGKRTKQAHVMRYPTQKGKTYRLEVKY